MSFLTVVLFLFLLSVLIFIHEFGHFMTAIRNGIKAEEFGFGFPPRLFGVVHDDSAGKWRIVFGDREVVSKKTVYSVNLIPFGGFVRMKGEDENGLDEPDSFASKSAWVRIKVLSAGVAMNFALAWFLITALFLIGFPQAVTDETRAQAEETFVQVIGVGPGSPAESMGMLPGDRIVSVNGIPVGTTDEVRDIVASRKGTEIAITLVRGRETLSVKGTPRVEAPENEGALGISFTEVGVIRYPWYEAPIRGMKATWYATVSVLAALWAMLSGLFMGQGGGTADVTGPVGIVYLTKQMSELGIAYLIQFAAILSVNLAIFNILPFPGLDGGRILFVLIEKLKGSPVTEAVEQRAHQIGFLLLLVAMIAVTFRDFSRFELLAKIGNLF